jgi:phosphatidylserine decarboxylase
MKWRPTNSPVAREALPFALPLGLLTVASLAAGWIGPAVLLAVLFFYTLLFFRNPVRNAAADADAIICPADGVVVACGPTGDQAGLGAPALRIAVFMSLFDVHINWSPCAGRIVSAEHFPGRFLNAMDDKSSAENERKVLLVERHDGRRLAVRLVAGLVARRIVCPLEPGDQVAAGEKIGLIRFGSRVEVILPADATLRVAKGDRVRGGETVLATLPSAAAESGGATTV